MTSILVIPDCHSTPEGTSDRFTWLGKYIVDEQPDYVNCLGDFLDMKSLSSYDRGRGSGEGQRVVADLAAGERDMNALLTPTAEHNERCRKSKVKQYAPDMNFLWGNHEDRISKFVNDNPALKGVMDIADFADCGWTMHEFLAAFHCEGIAFSHFFPSKMGRAIGGVNAARSILNKNKMSCVAGHSHEWDICIDTRNDGQKMFGLVAGWYGEMDHSEKWSRGSDHTWTNGVTMLRGVENGFMDSFEFISQRELRNRYGAQ